jgi:hypothetical protein
LPDDIRDAARRYSDDHDTSISRMARELLAERLTSAGYLKRSNG